MDTNPFGPFFFPINSQISRILVKFLVLTYSLNTDVNFDLRSYVGVSLTNEYNASTLQSWSFKFNPPYELIIAPNTYLHKMQALQNSSHIHRTFYRQIFSERSIFFWLTNNHDNIFQSEKSFRFNINSLPPVSVGAPSLSFSARYIYINAHMEAYTYIWSTPWQLYKSLQWNSNGRAIQGLVLIRLQTPYYFKTFAADHYACLRFVFFQSEYSLHCGSEIMSAIYLSLVHNATLVTHDRTKPKQIEEILDLADDIEYFLTRTVGPNEPIKSKGHETLGHLFSSIHDMFPIYCELNRARKEPYSDISVWTLGFVPMFWFQLIIGFILLAWLYNKRITTIHKKHLTFVAIFMTLIAMISRQSIIRTSTTKGRLIGITMLWLASAVLTLYENSIVSVITVPSPPKIFTTLPDALKAGYKFMWSSDDYIGSSFQSFFGPEFRALGVIHLINDSYVTANWAIFWTKRFLTEKILFPAYQVNIVPNMAIIKKAAVVAFEKENVALCYKIPDSVHKGMDLWEMHVSNRHWLILTASRISASGLINKWDEWANIAYLYKTNGKLSTEDFQEDLSSDIDFDKFLVPFVVFAVIYFLSIIVFVVEYFWEILVSSRSRTKILW